MNQLLGLQVLHPFTHIPAAATHTQTHKQVSGDFHETHCSNTSAHTAHTLHTVCYFLWRTPTESKWSFLNSHLNSHCKAEQVNRGDDWTSPRPEEVNQVSLQHKIKQHNTSVMFHKRSSLHTGSWGSLSDAPVYLNISINCFLTNISHNSTLFSISVIVHCCETVDMEKPLMDMLTVPCSWALWQYGALCEKWRPTTAQGFYAGASWEHTNHTVSTGMETQSLLWFWQKLKCSHVITAVSCRKAWAVTSHLMVFTATFWPMYSPSCTAAGTVTHYLPIVDLWYGSTLLL